MHHLQNYDRKFLQKKSSKEEYMKLGKKYHRFTGNYYQTIRDFLVDIHDANMIATTDYNRVRNALTKMGIVLDYLDFKLEESK
tara:strand:+ start:381 stop:629 length:249 start_codon:yes stop_codon:yes gene_type:complete